MRNKAISFTFLCMLIPFSRCQFCQIRISRNEIKDLCCAYYEKREHDCIACSKGYTSDMGQNCKPCPKNNYGERCLFECSCQDFEVCDNVEGCVKASSTTDSSMYATSDTFIQPDSAKTCIVNNERGEILKVCCADFEEKGDGCRACLKGFTSDIGQNCRPCPKHSYGEKCDFVCSCTNNEMCDHVQGCVPSLSTSGNSVYATSDASDKRLSEKNCYTKTESEKLKVCCADFEEKGNSCKACLKGFTSDAGQNCRPCLNHRYGDKCGFDCKCTDDEMCDHIEGCVISSPTSSKTSSTSAYANSYISISYRETTVNGESTDCSVQGLFSREVIVYSALSVLVIGFGICLGLVFFKYKTITQKYTATINQTQISSIPQQIQTIEIADRLYDIINDEDIIDDRRIQQMQMSSNYLDVVHDSNTRESCESKSLDNQDNPCQLLSIIQMQNKAHNLKVDERSLMSSDSTSSSDEYQWDSTQDYLNPYQPMLDISPPVENKYLTIATAHTREDVIHKGVALVRNEYKLHHPRKHGELAKDAMTKLYDKHTSASVSFGSNVTKGVSIKEGGKESKSYENLNVEWFKIEGE